MRIFKRDDRVELTADDLDDLWILFNLVTRGDFLNGVTTRKVKSKSLEKGSGRSEKKSIRIWLQVKSTEYDHATGSIRASGLNKSDSQHISKNQFHTLEIGMGSQVTLKKFEWSWYSEQLLASANDAARKAQYAVALLDGGIANLYRATSCTILHVAKVVTNIPRRQDAKNHNSATQTFFGAVFRNLTTHFDLERSRCLVIASPGLTKDQFLTYLNQNVSHHKSDHLVGKIRHKILLIKTTSVFKQGLQSVLQSEELAEKLSQLSLGEQQRISDLLFSTMRKNPLKVAAGLKEVLYAEAQGSISVLLVTEKALRSENTFTRRRVLQLCQDVKFGGGKMETIPDQLPSGEQLNVLGGVAAILKFEISTDEMDAAVVSGEDEAEPEEDDEDVPEPSP